MIRIGLVLLTGLCFIPGKGGAQSVAQCLEQLTLDYEKLAGMKSVLQQMCQGYKVLNNGYNAVKDVSRGNFNLHATFLDGLLVVSPAVRKYPRAVDIINDQAALVSESKAAAASFRREGHFSPEEINYLTDVYGHLARASLKNLDDLLMVLTDRKLRMSDAERLTAIDRIYSDSRSQMSFLKKFNDRAYQTARQRAKEGQERQTLKSLYGIN